MVWTGMWIGSSPSCQSLGPCALRRRVCGPQAGWEAWANCGAARASESSVRWSVHGWTMARNILHCGLALRLLSVHTRQENENVTCDGAVRSTYGIAGLQLRLMHIIHITHQRSDAKPSMKAFLRCRLQRWAGCNDGQGTEEPATVDGRVT